MSSDTDIVFYFLDTAWGNYLETYEGKWPVLPVSSMLLRGFCRVIRDLSRSSRDIILKKCHTCIEKPAFWWILGLGCTIYQDTAVIYEWDWVMWLQCVIYISCSVFCKVTIIICSFNKRQVLKVEFFHWFWRLLFLLI